MARIRRRFGYLLDKLDPRDWDEDKLGLTARKLPEHVSMRAAGPPVYDQGSTNSCVAQAMAGAIQILEQRAAGRGVLNVSTEIPSRLFMYYNSRKQHDTKWMLLDRGTYLRTCADGMRKLGVPDESHWQFSMRSLRVNRRPGFNAYMMGHARRGGEYFRIGRGGGQERVHAIKAALAEGYPVAFGTRATESFLDNRGTGVQNIVHRPVPSDPIVGGHAMLIVGYNVTDDGLLFEVRNSWGTYWRDHGHAWFTEDAIRWIHARDFQLVRGWDRIKVAA